MKSLSDRTQNIAASLTVAIDTMAKQMIADGKDVVSLGAGEPDFGTPTPIQDAAIEAIRAGKTRYTAPVGILDVRKAVAKKLEEENGLHYDASQIIMTSGAKHAVFNALAALINPGDEVIIPAPYWVTYPELVKWLGGTPVFVEAGIEKNTEAVLSVLSNPYVDILGHPDDSNTPLDYERIIARAAETGTIIEVNENSYRQPGLRSNCRENMDRYLELFRKATPDTAGIRLLAETLGDVLPAKITEDLVTIMNTVEGAKEAEFAVAFDPTLVRGMSYYTGPIFEISMDEYGGSVGGGGRYDEMIGRFTGQPTPACGFSIGFERIVMLLLERDFKVPGSEGKTAYLVEKGMPGDKLGQLLAKAKELRSAGAEINIVMMKKNKKFQKEQLTAEGYTEIVEFFADKDIN